jgi:hypothetical protein
MTREEITDWALKNGWRMLDGVPCLVKPKRPTEAIVRLILKATVVNLEVKKPAGKWEKMGGAAYAAVLPDSDTGVPRGIGLVSLPAMSLLMRDNKDLQVFG